jgi:hypothetical protein
MGKLFTPQDISSGFNTTNSLNTNFDNIETALDRTLSRYADTPNAMESDLDMNNNDLINAGLVSCDTLEVGGAEIPTLQALQDLLDGTESALDAKVVEASGYASSASLSASQSVTAQGLAEAAQLAAEAAAASVGLPVIGSGDAGKAVLVNGTEDGYEYSTLPTDPDTAITARLASQVEAEAGTDNTKLMTPLRTQQNFEENIVDPAHHAATDGSSPGTVHLVNDTEAALALSGNTVYSYSTVGVIPALELAQAAAALAPTPTASGGSLTYGNVRIQWGVEGATGTDTTITFPVAFTEVPIVSVTTRDTANGVLGDSGNIGSTLSTTAVNVRHGAAVDAVYWIAFGKWA